jgi:hypothetical protein
MGSGDIPEWYHTAVAEMSSTTRSTSPYQPRTVTVCQEVGASRSTWANVGSLAAICGAALADSAALLHVTNGGLDFGGS